MKWNDLSWLRSNRTLLISQIIGVPLVIAWFLLAYSKTHSPVVLVLLALVPVSVVANLVIINRKRSRLADPAARRDSLTGEVVAPANFGWSPPSGYQQWRWTGAADVPGSMGRWNASVPLGVLELAPGRLTLRVRPGFLTAMFGGKPLKVSPAEVEAIFPARVRLRYKGIGIRPYGEPPSYFLMRRQGLDPECDCCFRLSRPVGGTQLLLQLDYRAKVGAERNRPLPSYEPNLPSGAVLM